MSYSTSFHNLGALYRENNELHLCVRPPTQAIYYVSISGLWVGCEDGKKKDESLSQKENDVKVRTSIEVSKWKLDARGYTGAAGLNGRYPAANGNEYGPTELAIQKKVLSTIPNGVIKTDNGIST